MARLMLNVASSVLLMQAVRGTTLALSKNNCPNGWSVAQTQLNGQSQVYCCYGSIAVENNDGYCCVHNSTMPSDADSDGETIGGNITDSCFPFCPTTARHMHKTALPSQQCIDKVPLTASDYSERVSAASRSATASQTSGSRPSSNSASATSSTLSSNSADNSDSVDSPAKNAAPVTSRGALHIGGLVVAVLVLMV